MQARSLEDMEMKSVLAEINAMLLNDDGDVDLQVDFNGASRDNFTYLIRTS